MRILLVNKFHYLKGGSEKYYFELGKLLKEHGHEIAYFSMKDENNIKTGDKEYFVEPSDMNGKNIFKAFDVIYSKSNKKAMKKVLDEFKPDIIHVNNFQRQLSASIIKAAKEKNIPVVYTAHDLQAICPNIVMLDRNKNVCEKCKQGKYINCAKKGCIKESKLKSVLGMIESYYYRKNEIYTRKINCIITPTEFYKQKMIEDGIREERIFVIKNFLYNIESYNIDTSDNNYALYIGRLSKEKGVLNLLNAFSTIKDGKLYIAGDGPEKKNILKIIKEKELSDRVKILGYVSQEKIKELISQCTFTVVPSIWYENCPYSILEVLTIGKPVIGSNIAGNPELIEDHINGLLYEFDNIEELSDKMQYLFNNKDIVINMGINARNEATKKFSKDLYYEKIYKIYNSLIESESV